MNTDMYSRSSSSNYSNSDSGAFSSPNISPINESEVEPDKPIGYGAFGVVWAVTDPRDRKRVALKKMPYVFTNRVSAKRVYRELKILATLKHDNILRALDILLPPENLAEFNEVYVVTELLQSDLHKIIVSSQTLSFDHVTILVRMVKTSRTNYFKKISFFSTLSIYLSNATRPRLPPPARNYSS